MIKWIIYPLAKTVRLYDLRKDPEEMVDLAGKKKYKKVMNELFEQFKELQEEVGDPLDVREYYDDFINSSYKSDTRN